MANQVPVLKIALIGTSCIGKTTLLEEYRKKFINDTSVALVDEAARIYFAQNPNVTDRFSKEAQGNVQALALQLEQKAHASGAKLIICDRSVIDAVVYLRAHADYEGARQLLEKVRFWLPTYSTILLLDPEDVPYQVDAIRQENEKERQDFHNAYLEFFEEYKLPYTLLSGTVDQRLVQIDEILGLDT